MRMALVCSALTANTAYAVTIFESKEISLYTQGYISINGVNAGNTTRFQDGSSRIGVGLNTAIYDDWTAGFYLEYGLRIISSFRPQVYQPSTNGSMESLYLRYGNIFVEDEVWGKFTAGKQPSVYYDVTQITDNYFVSGGLASGTYPLATDGGFVGTGRADSAFTWRKPWHWLGGKVQLGLQYATPSAELEIPVEAFLSNNRFVLFPDNSSEEGTNQSISLIYEIDLGKGLFIGASYNRSESNINSDEASLFNLSDPDGLVFITSSSTSGTNDTMAAGISYGKGALEKGFYGSAVFQHSSSDSQELVVSERGQNIFFDARGSESFFSYTWGAKNCYSVFLGHNSLRSDNRIFSGIPPVVNNFRLLQYYFGFQYRWSNNVRFYFENAFDYSNRVARADVNNYSALGIFIEI